MLYSECVPIRNDLLRDRAACLLLGHGTPPPTLVMKS
jgi:hypothetical protein